MPEGASRNHAGAGTGHPAPGSGGALGLSVSSASLARAAEGTAGLRRCLAAGVLCLPLAVVLAGRPLGLPGFLRVPLLGCALAIAPGLAWIGLARARAMSVPRAAASVIGLSCLCCLFVLAGGAVLMPVTGPAAHPALLATVTLAGGLLRRQNERPEPGQAARHTGERVPVSLLAGVFLVTLAAAAFAAVHLVPPLEDHDMEVQGTAWGLASLLRPDVATNRETPAYYAHPLLLHAFVAVAAGVDGELPSLRYYAEAGRTARALQDAGRPVDWDGLWKSEYDAYRAHPAFVATRAANVAFAACGMLLLAWLCWHLTGSVPLAGLGSLLALSVPETLVRQAYGGYHAVTILFLLIGVGLYIEAASTHRTVSPVRLPGGLRGLARMPLDGAALACGLLGALAEQKLLLLVLAVLAHRLLTPGPAGGGGRFAPDAAFSVALSLAGGFVLGNAVWFGYGLILDPATFIRDHVQLHLVNRFLLNDVRFTASAVRYAPSIPALWTEFLSHTGWLIVPLGALGAAGLLGRRHPAGVLAFWIAIGAVGFSVTDWRQTKHLMLILPAVAAGAVAAVALAPKGLRTAASAALAACLLLNAARDAALVADWHSLTITGASEVDGW